MRHGGLGEPASSTWTARSSVMTVSSPDIRRMQMRAIVQFRYGPPSDVLELRDIDKPAVAKNEVLVRVHAASVHPDVWHVVNGRPYFLRIMGAGLRKPKISVPGTDIAGQVEAAGKNVMKFQAGDDVFGEIVRGHQWKNGGAYAEYAAVPEDKLEFKPSNLTFEQAAAIPTSGLIALRGLRDEGQIQQGHKVLVNGAGGAVGTFAVQIAKAHGAAVTAVDSAPKQNMLRSIGADRVIDYAQEDFTRSGERYDLVFDIPGNRSFEELKRVVADDGRYVLIGHDQYGRSGNRWLGGTIGRILKLQILAPFGRGKRGDDDTTETKNPLIALKDLAEAGKIMPAIDRTFPLGEVPEAI